MNRFKENFQARLLLGLKTPFWKQAAGLAGIAIAYWGTVRFGLLFVAHPEDVASIWPASGLALAVLILNPKNQWAKLLAVIFITNTVGNLNGGNSILVSLGFALANILEALLGAWVLTWICKTKITFDRPVEVVALFGVATASNSITALLGAAVPSLAFNAPYFSTWLVWWASDGLGIILVTPLIVTWMTDNNSIRSLPIRRIIEASLLALIAGLFSWIVFSFPTITGDLTLRSYMLFPILILLALRYNLRGVSSVLLLLAVVAIWNTLEGRGTFTLDSQDITVHLISVQIFLWVITFSSLFLSATLTELKETRNDLRDSEEKFKYLFEHSTVGKSLTTPNGHLTPNKTLCDMLGYTEAELKAKKWHEITHPDDIDESQKWVDKLFSGKEKSIRFTKRYIRKDCAVIWVDISSTVRRDKDGKLLYTLTSVSNVTDQRRAEEALRESEKQYRSLFDNMTEGFAIHELIFNEKGEPCDYRFLDINRAFEKLTGLRREDLIGKAQSEVLPGEDPFWLKMYSRVTLTGKSVHLEHYSPILKKYYEVYAYCPAPNQFATVFMDITERKQAEEEVLKLNSSLEQRVEERTRELRKAQDQLVRQEKLAVLGQMAGSVSHELRNPLGVISNAVYFLKMIQPDANEKVREYLDLIEKNLNLSNKIVTDLLDFTRIKTVDRESISVTELIRQTLERFPPPEPVKVTLNIPPDTPRVYADPYHIVQILGNLVLNAGQVMTPKGGTLTVSSHTQNDTIGISVQDTGVGIPPENMEKIFEPLFTTKPKGIGLGLAVSKKLIEANGGKIEFQSKTGVGSTFTIYLPIDKRAS